MTTERRADCHAHIIAPPRFPYADGPGYKPGPGETGDADRFRRTLDAHGISHALLVQPSCYGYDNACMLEAMAQSAGRFCGIAVVAPHTGVEEMQALKEKGVVGVRLNLMYGDAAALHRPDAGRFLARVKDLGWVLQVFATGAVWCGIGPLLRRSGVRLVIDHFGGPDPGGGVGQPGFAAVLALGRQTEAVVKLSAPFRASARPYPHPDAGPFIAAAVDAFGLDRCVWGSDWPFINTAQQVDYGDLFRLLTRWLPDAADRERVLWSNPARLFGFA